VAPAAAAAPAVVMPRPQLAAHQPPAVQHLRVAPHRPAAHQQKALVAVAAAAAGARRQLLQLLPRRLKTSSSTA
jgi:hypothetical protein